MTVPAPPPLPPAPELYALTTETGMPHLEENLRYTITHEKRCLTRQALFVSFPILAHPALAGCRLAGKTRQSDTVAYSLVCSNATTGAAVWNLDTHRIRGTLNVKLGGKNMTFYQRVTALPLGKCD